MTTSSFDVFLWTIGILAAILLSVALAALVVALWRFMRASRERSVRETALEISEWCGGAGAYALGAGFLGAFSIIVDQLLSPGRADYSSDAFAFYVLWFVFFPKILSFFFYGLSALLIWAAEPDEERPAPGLRVVTDAGVSQAAPAAHARPGRPRPDPARLGSRRGKSSG